MAEFAAAASGAGLASLGVQCCKGLASYYALYKGYNEQTSATYEEIEVLTDLFDNLEQLFLRSSADPAQNAAVQQVKRGLVSCRGRLE